MAVITLIVMEPGSEWPGRVGSSDDVIAVGHDIGEGVLDKTRKKLDAILERRDRLRLAVLACNPATDDVLIARRRALAHELLTAVAAGAFGRLVLTAPDRAPFAERVALLALAGELSHRVRGATTSVSVRFGDGGCREIGLADGLGAEILTHALRDHCRVQAG